MIVDAKNISRTDLAGIYEEAKMLSQEALRGTDVDVNVFAITDRSVAVLHLFAMRGCGYIASKTRMIKHVTQTGLDALTLYSVMEDVQRVYEEVSEDDEDEPPTEVTSPDDITVKVSEITGRAHVSGQKLQLDRDYVLFHIDGLDSEKERRTIIQEFIAEALVNYVLFEWWKLKGMNDKAALYSNALRESIKSIKVNSVTNRKNYRVRPRPLG